MVSLVAAAALTVSMSPVVLAASPETISSGQACRQAREQHQPLAGCTDADGNPVATKDLNQPGGYLNDLVDVFIYGAGFLAFTFLIVGGIRYITSTGDAKRIQAAKDTVMYSMIGLVVVILARLVVGFIIENAS
jgi:hypothetical protein